MQLVIMAAGMGSRFGGLKQITPMGPNGEFIIDYSIYDAIKCGFSKVIFIIKEENYNIFKETIGSRVEPHVDVEYVFQKVEDVPEFVKIPANRVKPWGTAHAIYAAKDAVTEPFIVINADDYYGYDAYKVASEYLENNDANHYGLLGYKVTNTLTDNGSVKRGVITCKNGMLDNLDECSIEWKDSKLMASPLNGNEPYEISTDTLVSMNMLMFDPSIFAYLEKQMNKFFKENAGNLDKCEFLIPDVLSNAMKEGYAKVSVVPTNSTWYGVTYKEDAAKVKESLAKLHDDGMYPTELWEDEMNVAMKMKL